MTRSLIAGDSMRPLTHLLTYSQARLLTCLLALCLLAAGPARAASLLYQWDFNSPTGDNTTVTPLVGSGGVLTMSQETVNGSFGFDGPFATNLYSAAGTGVFGSANPNDRAFNNSGTVFDIKDFGPIGSHAGIAASDNGTVPPAMNSTLSSTAGSHSQITLTSWVKLDNNGILTDQSNPVLLAIGEQNYDDTKSTGTYLGFFNNFGGSNQINTLQFTANGAGTGVVGGNGIIDQFKADWMFVAVTYDSTAMSGNVKMYVGNKTASLAAAASSGTLAAGAADLNSAHVYIGSNTADDMGRGLGAMIDDVRIYDGVLDQYQLNLVRQNLATPGQGDMDQNGVTDAGDIGAMMTALINVPGYQALHGNMSMSELVALGDFVDDHNVVDNADLQGLITFLANGPPGGGMLSAVPEPTAWLLLLTGGFGAVLTRFLRPAAQNCRQ
jgi:hypothetical protein